jgi:Domain of unknown function (DUF4388)
LKAQGSLAERDLADVVHELHKRRWTGTLILSHAGVGRSVKVQAGRLVFASSTNPDDRLGELLLRRGRISLRQYVDAGRGLGPGKRLGAVLVEAGALDPDGLIRAVVEHTQEIIYEAFQWNEGQYRLQEGDAGSESITLRMSTPDVILEGIRRIQSWRRVDRGVGGIDARYARAPDYEPVAAQTSLSTEQLEILTSLHDERRVEEICDASALADFEVCQTLWAFRVIGLVRRLDVPAPAVLAMEDEGLGFVITEE